MVTPQTTWSVSGGTCGVRTVRRVKAVATGRLARSVQYTQPWATSCRNTVSTVSGVVVLYETARSYWWPGVTFGAHEVSSSIIALRSPLPAALRLMVIALLPLCPGWLTENE